MSEEVHIHYDVEGNEAGRTVVTRQSPWDDEQREIALDMQSYERQLCPSCHGHMSKTMDASVARDVQHEHVECLDCKAIDQVRAAHHKNSGHTDDRCDCNRFMTWVDRYVPVPPPR